MHTSKPRSYMASRSLTAKWLFAMRSLDAVPSIDSVEGAHALDSSRAVSAFSTWPYHHARSFKGRPHPGLDVNFLPTQQPRNGSNDRDSPHSLSARCSPGSSAQSLKANARVALQKHFACNVLSSAYISFV